MAVPAEQTTKKTDKTVQTTPTPIIYNYLHRNIKLYNRRKKLLLLIYSGQLSENSLKELARLTDTKYATLYKDLQRRQKWEPYMWACYQGTEDAKEHLKLLELAEENCIQLIKTADNDSARVGAIRTLVYIEKTKIELRQSLGLLPKTTTDLTQIIFDQSTTNIDVALKAEIDKIIQFSRIEEKQSERT